MRGFKNFKGFDARCPSMAVLQLLDYIKADQFKMYKKFRVILKGLAKKILSSHLRDFKTIYRSLLQNFTSALFRDIF